MKKNILPSNKSPGLSSHQLSANSRQQLAVSNRQTAISKRLING